jgi:hypothetical protein
MRKQLAKAVCASLSPLSFAEGLARRLSGPASFRFILQPLVATIAGIRDGVSDAKLGLPPYWGRCAVRFRQ